MVTPIFCNTAIQLLPLPSSLSPIHVMPHKARYESSVSSSSQSTSDSSDSDDEKRVLPTRSRTRRQKEKESESEESSGNEDQGAALEKKSRKHLLARRAKSKRRVVVFSLKLRALRN